MNTTRPRAMMLVESQACRTDGATLACQEHWRAGLEAKGWRHATRRRSRACCRSTHEERAVGPEEVWDRFIDALDRAGQVGGAGGVLVPAFATHALGGKRFGDLSKDDVRFTSSGGWSGPLPFPAHLTSLSDPLGQQGLTTAFPSIWKFAGAEALMVPVVYHALSTTEIRLLAFSMGGSPLGETLVTRWTDQVTSDTGPFDFLFPPFHPGSTVPSVSFPGVAISSDGGTPSIVVADHVHDVVGYTFVTDGNTGTFTERFRVHDDADDNGVLGSPPILLADGHSAIGSGDGRLVFAGPNPRPLAAVTGMDPVWFAPTRLVDGRLVLVEGRRVFVLQNNVVQARISLPFSSSASAAASFNHFFVATTDRFLTFDASTLSEVASAPWSGGGQWPPVIGPQGHVYAMAGNVLFVFPPPGPAAVRPVIRRSRFGQ